ncbi:hypothetical protein B1757_03310 [Acidithiobacillus marinus]|uniref:Uncharacterized protein n=1 Tax=Acidithiobacillus marinus TaxID=187490 RepID=A0A2I1DPA4_9PROT|nr:hypothetical protein [Acidithiobacillus marinus]PKY11703.1 hypothetical protein B1757_03310 [Acidithiobacillus marinus]
MLESRFESLFAELENAITDYRGLRRQREGDGRNPHSVQTLQSQIQKLKAENRRLQERQEEICVRLNALLAQVNCWENDL